MQVHHIGRLYRFNSLSIGIELDFSDNKKNNKFSQKMIKSS